MKIAVFTENMLAASGGAEVYALKLAEVLNSENDVTVFTIANKQINNKNAVDVYKKYNINPILTKEILFKHLKNLILDMPKRFLLWLKLKSLINGKFDIFINCNHNRMLGFENCKSIHLIHFPLKNYAHFFPMGIGKFLNRKYKKSYNFFISNSEFTKYHLKKEWDCESVIINPPICMKPIDEREFLSKENIILMVGRIVPDKKFLDVLKFFENHKNDDIIKKYKLVIVGNKDNDWSEYFNELKSYEDKINLELYTDLSYDELLNWYKKAKFFLHAKGYNQSDENPILMEHFGMTTVEAMANGCVPIVINKAGQKEIVQNKISGFLWDELTEIKEILECLEQQNILQFQKAAIERSKLYLEDQFAKKVKEIIQGE